MKLPKKEEVSQEAQDTWKEEIKEQLEFLNTKMDKQLLVKEEMINRLHKELECYKNDTAGKFEEQLMKAVITVRENMKKKLAEGQLDGLDTQHLIREYTYVFEDLTDLLERQLCDEIQSRPGDKFNPAIHQAKVEETDDPALDKTVKCSLSAGYMKKEKVLIPERVIAFRYNQKDE